MAEERKSEDAVRNETRQALCGNGLTHAVADFLSILLLRVRSLEEEVAFLKRRGYPPDGA